MYKAVSPSFINNVSTKAFEKKIVDICRDICRCFDFIHARLVRIFRVDSAYRSGYLFVAVLILYMQDSSVKRGYHISKDTNINEKW